MRTTGNILVLTGIFLAVIVAGGTFALAQEMPAAPELSAPAAEPPLKLAEPPPDIATAPALENDAPAEPEEAPGDNAIATVEPEPAGDDFITIETPEPATGGIDIVPDADNLINVTVEDESLENVVNMFTRISGANIVATAADLEGTVTVSLRNVAWKPALSSILDVHQLALIEKIPGSGVYSIVPKPPEDMEPLMVESVFLHYTTVADMVPIVQSMLAPVTNASISQFASRNAMIVRSTESNIEEIKQLVEQMDVPSKQVCVETQFMELNDEASTKIGLRWDSLDEFGMRLQAGPFEYGREITRDETRENAYDSADTITTIEDSLRGSSDRVLDRRYYDTEGTPLIKREFELFDPNPDIVGDEIIQVNEEPTRTDTLESENSSARSRNRTSIESTTHSVMDAFNKAISESQAAILDVDSFNVVLSALKKTDGVSIISNPKIIVTSGSEDAFFSVGDREPIVKTEIQSGTQDSPGDKLVAQLDTSINTDYIKDGYLETGINLDVVPVVKTDDMIEALIKPKLVRRLLPDKVVGNNSWPRIAVKEIQTKFTLQSGQTVAIGGLTDTSDAKKVSKIPLLGDVPLLGKYLFSHTSDVKKLVETIIFVTLSLAEPESLYREAGIPGKAQLVHKQLIEDELRRQQFETELEQLRESADEDSASRAKARLLRRKQ